MKRSLASFVLVGVAVTLVAGAAPAAATIGHFLHGVGAVNSAMGGAGVALPTGALGALHTNPALLTKLPEHSFDFSLEMINGDLAVESQVSTPFGPFSGRTEDVSDANTIPAFAWTHHADGSRVAVGVGFMGLAGFKTDYPEDSANPILLPQPQGFGRLFSDYELLDIPVTVAFQATPKLSVGVALNLGYASFAAEPIPVTPPDCNGPTSCFFPSVQQDGAMGAGFRLGLYYEASPVWSFGLSYSSPQWFEDFEWASAAANPNLPNFGTDRRVKFNIDTPQTLTVGLGFHPGARWRLALDARYINYADADGFGDTGFTPAGAIRGLGWKNIWVGMLGVELQASRSIVLRAGLASGETPVTEDTTFFNVASPALVKQVLSVGAGFRVYSSMDLNLAVYHGFQNRVSGPFQSPFGPVPGTRVTNEITQNSVVVTFSFHP